MAGKRSKAAMKSAGKKVMITGAQRKARKLNIEIARRAKKSGMKGSSKGAGASMKKKIRGISRRERDMLMFGADTKPYGGSKRKVTGKGRKGGKSGGGGLDFGDLPG